MGQDCDAIWSKVERLVASALTHAHGEIRTEDIRALAVASKAQVWVVYAKGQGIIAVAVTEFVDYARMCVLRVIGMAGIDLHTWFAEFNAALQQYARKHGAKRIEAACRGGLARMLDRYGYKPAYVILLQEVERGETSRDNEERGDHRTPGIPDTLHSTAIN